MVEMPYLSSSEQEDIAFHPFGGVDQVKACIESQKKNMFMKFNREDPLKPPLQGTREAACGLLVRVRRRKQVNHVSRYSINPNSSSSSSSQTILNTQSASSIDQTINPSRKRSKSNGSGNLDHNISNANVYQDDKTSFTIIGRVSAKYQFDRPADYIFLSSCPASDYKTELTPTNNILVEAVPRPFINYVESVDPDANVAENDSSATSKPGYTSVCASDTRDEETESAIAKIFRNSPWMANATLVVAGDRIPMSSANSFWNDKSHRSDEAEMKVQALTAWIKSVFERRACWSKAQLVSCYVASRYLLKDLLVREAYYFISGPFRDYWVRWGYNPAKLHQSRLLQLVHVKITIASLRELNAKVWSKVGSARQSNQWINLDSMSWAAPQEQSEEKEKDLPQKIPLILFDTRIKLTTSFQICNLHASEFLEMVRKAKVLPVWSQITGWFSQTTLDLFAALIFKFLEKKIDEFIDRFQSSGTQRKVPPAPAVVMQAPRKVEVELPGFSRAIWEWQARYEELPAGIARTREEGLESEIEVGRMIHPDYKPLSIKIISADVMFKKIMSSVQKRTKGSKEPKASAKASEPRATHSQPHHGTSSAAAEPCMVPDIFLPNGLDNIDIDPTAISAYQPFEAFSSNDVSGNSGEDDDSWAESV